MTTPMRIFLLFSFFLLPEMTVFAAYRIPMEVSIPVENAQAYNKLVLGAQPGATDRYDMRWDTPALFTTPDPEQPPLFKAYVVHPEYADSRQELWRDIRSDDAGVKTWTLNVDLAPSQVGKIVTVSWTLPSSLASSGDRVTLADPDAQETIDMRSHSSYRFVGGSSTESKTLSVTVSPSSGSSDNGSSGGFGCGVVTPVNPDSAGGGASIAVLINLLVLFSPLFLRFRRRPPRRATPWIPAFD